MSKPLEGVRVLDFTWAQQGPYGTTLLADMGAEIIKIEAPGGERGRHIFPPGEPGAYPLGYFDAHNRGKRSVVIDLKKPGGKEIIHRLVKTVDIVVNNFRSGVMDKFDLDYESLKKINPGIVYANATGFGPLGKYAGKPGVDIMGQAMGGIMGKTGFEGHPPTPAAASIADQTGAILLCSGILAALVKKEKTGKGEQVDVSLYAGQLALQTWELTTYAMTGIKSGRGGTGHPVASKNGIWRVFECKDDYFVIGSVDMFRFKRLCHALGIPELSDKFPYDETRRAGLDEINAQLEIEFAKYIYKDISKIFDEQDVIYARVQDYDDILNDEHAKDNGYITTLNHPFYGEVTTVGCPIQFGGKPTELAGPPPELGDFTEIYLEQAGYTWEEIDQLKKDKVIE